MAKELPYFKFVPQEWINGDITLCSLEAQGLFVNLICLYWSKDCSISLAKAKQRFGNSQLFDELINDEVFIIDEDENIVIDFLDEQMDKFISVSDARSKAGSKGGKAKAKQKLSKCKANANIEEKRREEKKRVKEESKDLEIAFDSLWNKYPRKEGKKQAFNHYKVSLRKNKHELIELAVDNYIKKVQIEGIEPRFIKQGSTFFNNWQDYTMVEIDDSKQRTKGGKWDHLLAYK